LHTFNARGVLRSTGRTILLNDTADAGSPHARCLKLNMQGRLLADLPKSSGDRCA